MESSLLPLPKLPSYDHHGDNTSKLYAENEYLKERVRSCEKGLSVLYQLLMPKEEPPKVLTTHYRSASLTMRSRSNSHTSPSPIPDTKKTSDSKKKDDGRVVTFPELKEAIVKVVEDRDQLAMELDDHRQITEAAKRERVLAIEEKDLLLKESHGLRVALEKLAGKLKEADLERRELTQQIKNMEKDVNILQRSNEEAMVMRAIAVDERSKLIDDYSRLQNELTSVQHERSELLDETLQLQSTISQLTNENVAVVQRKHSNHGYSTISEGSRPAKTEFGGLRVKLTRITPGQPWGFSVDGGADCYHGDHSIVVSEVIQNMPAHKVLLAGDRLQSIGSYDLRSVTRKEALEIIRSCDQVSVDVMIKRTATIQKPVPQEVRIPGKKSFGFSYETRVFVSTVDREAQAAGTISHGDEIVQIMGKQTLNMKPSILKQLLKSCKDGVSMTIQAPVGVVPNGNVSPGKRLRYSSDSNYSQGTHIRTSGEVPHSSYQAPGTPGSSVSETSAGYHSLTHSMPSILSNAVPPVTMDTKTGQTGLEPVQHDYRTQSQLATYHEEGLNNPEPHPTTNGGRFRAGSVFSSRHRPRNLPRRSTVPALSTTHHSTQLSPRVRSTSQSSYQTTQTGLSSPRGYPPPATPSYRHRGTSLPRGLYPPTDHTHSAGHALSQGHAPHHVGHALSQGHAPHYDHFSSYIQRRKQVISMSADNLDFDPMAEPRPPPSHHTRISRTESHGNNMTTTSSHNVSVGASHMTRALSRDCQMNFSVPKRRPISMSMGSMTNV